MGKVSGKNGKLYMGAVQVHIGNWTLNDNVQTPDATDSQSGGTVTHVIGNNDWSFTCDCFWRDDTGAPLPDLTPGTEGTVKLYLDATRFYTGLCIIQSANPTVDVSGGGAVAYKVSGVSNGAITRPF